MFLGASIAGELDELRSVHRCITKGIMWYLWCSRTNWMQVTCVLQLLNFSYLRFDLLIEWVEFTHLDGRICDVLRSMIRFSNKRFFFVKIHIMIWLVYPPVRPFYIWRLPVVGFRPRESISVVFTNACPLFIQHLGPWRRRPLDELGNQTMRLYYPHLAIGVHWWG